MLDVTENGLSILRSEGVELGERHLVRDKVLLKKKSHVFAQLLFLLLSEPVVFYSSHL